MNKIKYSEKFTQWCDKHKLNSNLVYIVQCCLISNSECIDILLNSLEGETYDKLLRLVLCDPNEDGFVLRKNIPYFWEEDELVEVKEDKSKSTFNEYIQLLLDKGLNSKGSVNNQTSYLVIKKDKVTKEAFENLCLRIKDLDLIKLAEITVNYYKEGEFKTVLSKYLDSSAEVDYQSYKEKKVKPKFDEY